MEIHTFFQLKNITNVFCCKFSIYDPHNIFVVVSFILTYHLFHLEECVLFSGEIGEVSLDHFHLLF